MTPPTDKSSQAWVDPLTANERRESRPPMSDQPENHFMLVHQLVLQKLGGKKLEEILKKKPGSDKSVQKPNTSLHELKEIIEEATSRGSGSEWVSRFGPIESDESVGRKR